MGYAKGRRWTDEDVKQEVLKVKEWYGIDRIPSRKECKICRGLAEKISKREGGYYKLARELGLEIKESETTLGKECEKRIADILTKKGYNVEKMPQNHPYDLLVNNCIKVDVKASNLYQGKNIKFYSYEIGKKYATCDIYILLELTQNKSIKDIFIIPSVKVMKNRHISIGTSKSKYDEYKNNWTTLDKYITAFGFCI